MTAPVIMVHGAFCGGWAFDGFKVPFETAGHACLTPTLPGHGPGERDRVAGLSMTDYSDALARHIRDLAEPPILIGHSLGGLVAQMAAARERVRALVLLAPSAPWGISGGTMEEAATGMSLGAYWTQAVDPDPSLFFAYSADRLAENERRAAFARLVPESGRALFETLSWWLDPFMTTSVGRAVGAPPILVVAGGQDQVHAPSLVRQTAERCGGEYRLFPGMSHWLIGEPGFDEVADAVLRWLPGASKAAA